MHLSFETIIVWCNYWMHTCFIEGDGLISAFCSYHFLCSCCAFCSGFHMRMLLLVCLNLSNFVCFLRTKSSYSKIKPKQIGVLCANVTTNCSAHLTNPTSHLCYSVRIMFAFTYAKRKKRKMFGYQDRFSKTTLGRTLLKLVTFTEVNNNQVAYQCNANHFW